MTDKVVVLVMCGRRAEANRIARALVEKRLVACVNIFDTRVRSIYRWKGKVESAAEFLLLIKSSRRLLPTVVAEVERLHSYEVPEVIAVPVVGGARKYLYWVEKCLRSAAKEGKKR